MVDGPLAPKVIFPSPNEAISVRDSNFIFGSVGNGHASLTINGASVPVAPNGTFLAYLPVPPHSAPRYDLVVRNGADSATLTIPVRVPPPRPDLALDGRLVVDSSSVSPRGTVLSLRDDEPVRVTVRAPPNANAWVLADRELFRLISIGGVTFATSMGLWITGNQTDSTTIAFTGVLNFGWTAAIDLKNKPSSAIAKKTRGFASMVELSDPNVESMTVIATNATPAVPMTR